MTPAQTETVNINTKQPKVFTLAYFTTICERFGFYLLSFLLVLYIKSQYHIPDSQAFALFGVFTALAFLTPAIGGYLADNVIGIRRCIIGGLFLEGTGLCMLAIPIQMLFPIALALIIVGVGLFKTAPTDLLAHSYEKDDPRIDAGFTLYYMAINIGSFLSSIVAGVVQKYFGWSVAFLVGGSGIYLGLLFYFILRHSAKDPDSAVGKAKLSFKKWAGFVFGALVSVAISIFLVARVGFADMFFIAATIAVGIYFVYEIIKSPKEEKFKIIACLYLIVIGMLASIMYFQAFTSIELFIERCVVRNILGINIPTVIFLSLNPFFIVLLGPIFAWIYYALSKRKQDFSVITKLTIGLLLQALCFFLLSVGKYYANSAGQISSFFVVAMYFVYTAGELLNSALGVAMVTHIAPRRLYGVMMGAWFFIGNSLAASLSGLFAGLANVPDNVTDSHMILNIYSHAFNEIGVAGVIAALIAFAINPFIKKIAKIE